MEKMDKKLLSIKVIEESQSLRKKVGVWITQYAKGISRILKRAHTGIKKYFKRTKKMIESEVIGEQLSLDL